MALTWTQFIHDVHKFLQDEMNSGLQAWHWRSVDSTGQSSNEPLSEFNKGFLFRENVHVPYSLPPIATLSNNPPTLEFAEIHDSTDAATASPELNISDSGASFTYHIVYHTVYKVPVLYFNARSSNGDLLRLEQVFAALPASQGAYIDRAFLSQEEHPLLGVPYFHIHPCQVPALMSLFDWSRPTECYLKSWLSVMGPPVGLKMRPEWFASKTAGV